MKGKELEELRNQLDQDIDEFSRSIGISALDYRAYVKKGSIEDASVLAAVRSLQLQIERENLANYGRSLSAQPTGPFSAGKILAHLEAIATLRDHPESTPPITVEWHLSNVCDHDCPFCTFRESVHASADRAAVFPSELIPCVVEDLTELGVKAIVYSGGGEPLLHDKVGDVMRAVAKAGIRQGLVTNGANIDKPEIAEAIMETCEWVRVSVDAGSQQIYAATHGRRQDFSKVMSNIGNLVAGRTSSRPRIGVSFLLTMLNYTDLLASARLFRDVGVDYFQVKPIVISASDRLSSGNIFWKTDIFNQLAALPVQAQPEYEVYTLGFKFVDLMTSSDRKQFRKCHGHPFYPVIAATGDVYVCCLMIGKKEYCYGRVDRDRRFKDIWLSRKRSAVGESVDVRECPVNCKLSETNKTLEEVIGRKFLDAAFLN